MNIWVAATHRLSMFLTTLFLYTSLFPIFAEARYLSCKSTPNESTWPSASQWAFLNQSLSGRLLHPFPPATACQSSFTNFNLETCASIKQSWADFSFHQDTPVSV